MLYTNDWLEIIEEHQLEYVGANASGIYPVVETPQPTGVIILGFHIELQNGIRKQVWDYREKTSQELVDDKQSLIDQIEARQRAIFPLADGIMSKQKRRELSGKITKTEQDYNSQVADWADEVGYQNNVVTKLNLTLASNLTSGNSTCTLTSATGVSTLGKITFSNANKTWWAQVTAVNGNTITLDDVSPATFNTSATVQYIQSVPITTDLTKEALQARIDRLSELEASFPNI